MKISVFGLGYVGTVCAACFADRGHQVIGVDKSTDKVRLIQSGRSPIVERDIDELVRRSVRAGRLEATLDSSDAIARTDISIVCVGTPSQQNGALGLEAIKTVIAEIGHAIRSKMTRHVVVIRSTVLPGTTRDTIVPRLSEASGKTIGDGFGVAFNPEFLREGTSISDFNKPSRTIVGAFDEITAAEVMNLYQDLSGVKIVTEIETAELVKYVDNAWHALKVTFGNEVGLLANALSLDGQEIMKIFCEDKHLNISKAYLRPGFAFGGSCLPKDLRALVYLGRKLDLSLPVLNHVLASNRMLVERGIEWIIDQSSKRIAFLGISFKSGTDDLRESPFVEIVERLIGKGYEIRIFDPNVQLSRLVGANKEYLMRVIPHIADLIVPNISDAIDWAQAIVVTAADPIYLAGLNSVVEEQIVLDFARVDWSNDQLATHLDFLTSQRSTTPAHSQQDGRRLRSDRAIPRSGLAANTRPVERI
jgi:GDP-mannose 6-dehydrogenase